MFGQAWWRGINLTEANHAIFFNLWWNPSNNDQARDRLCKNRPKKMYLFIPLKVQIRLNLDLSISSRIKMIFQKS